MLLPLVWLGPTTPAHADIRVAAQGIAGEMLTAPQTAAVQAGIAKLVELEAGGTDFGTCAQCMTTMLANGRLCRETGTANATAGARTARDNSTDCNPKSDAINMNPLMMGVPEVAAGVLAHEWCHTGQLSTLPLGPMSEEPCYATEIAVLEALQAGTAATQRPWVDGRLEIMEKCLDEIRAASEDDSTEEGVRTPRIGGVIDSDDEAGTAYAVFSAESALHVTTMALGPRSHPLAAISVPFDLDVHRGAASGGADLVLVSGWVSPGLGAIEAWVVDAGEPSSLFTTETPGHPFDIAWDPSSASLFVLDTAADQVQVFDYGPTLEEPPYPATTFADASTSAAVTTALSLALASDELAGALTLTPVDHRQDHLVMPGADITVLWDDDGDRTADRVEQGTLLEYLFLPPGIPDPVRAGDLSVRTFASASTRVEVYTVDDDGAPQESVGSAQVPSDSQYVDIPLVRALVEGESITVMDLDHAFDFAPLIVQVEGAEPDSGGCACDATSPGPDTGWAWLVLLGLGLRRRVHRHCA